MHWTDQATCRPMRCAVVPYVGNGSGHAFIDTGQDLDLEHVYISDVGAEYIASEMLGWVRPEVVSRKDEEITHLSARVEQLEAELEEADKFKEHIDGLTKHGLAVRKVAGRKPKKEAVANGN